MLHDLLQLLQWAGCPNVAVSCHSWAPLNSGMAEDIVLNCSSSTQPLSALLALFAHQAARGTSGIRLNGLMSAARRIYFPLLKFLASKPTPGAESWRYLVGTILRCGLPRRHRA
jgi:hypothetical protein